MEAVTFWGPVRVSITSAPASYAVARDGKRMKALHFMAPLPGPCRHGPTLGPDAVCVQCPGFAFGGGAAAPGNSLVTGKFLCELLGPPVCSAWRAHGVPFLRVPWTRFPASHQLEEVELLIEYGMAPPGPGSETAEEPEAAAARRRVQQALRALQMEEVDKLVKELPPAAPRRAGAGWPASAPAPASTGPARSASNLPSSANPLLKGVRRLPSPLPGKRTLTGGCDMQHLTTHQRPACQYGLWAHPCCAGSGLTLCLRGCTAGTGGALGRALGPGPA